MPASIPYAQIHGDDIDLNPGPNGDLEKCYFDGAITLNAGYATETKYRDYRGHNSAMTYVTPEFSVNAPLILKREASTFGQVVPGSGLSRAVIACAGDRGAHGFPMSPSDPGYFVVGPIAASVDLGQHRKYPLTAQLFGFAVTYAVNGGV